MHIYRCSVTSTHFQLLSIPICWLIRLEHISQLDNLLPTNWHIERNIVPDAARQLNRDEAHTHTCWGICVSVNCYLPMEFISTRYLNHRLITRNGSAHKSEVLWIFKIKSTRFACEVPIRLPGNNKSTHTHTRVKWNSSGCCYCSSCYPPRTASIYSATASQAVGKSALSYAARQRGSWANWTAANTRWPHGAHRSVKCASILNAWSCHSRVSMPAAAAVVVASYSAWTFCKCSVFGYAAATMGNICTWRCSRARRLSCTSASPATGHRPCGSWR